MKKILIVMFAAAITASCGSYYRQQVYSLSDGTQLQDLGSTGLASNFRFIPQTMRLQPGGSSQQIFDARNNLTVSDQGWVAINLPFIQASVPPFRRTYLNYRIDDMKNHTIQTTRRGWTVKFETGLFSSVKYTFTIDYNASNGQATLDISSPDYRTVTYQGFVQEY